MDLDVDEPSQAVAPPPDRLNRVRFAVRVFGELLITAGLVVLLFVFYIVYVTDWFSSHKQAQATQQLQRQWDDLREHPSQREAAPPAGAGFARLYVPAFGPDYQYTIVEGTDATSLEAGPGRYRGTAPAGQQGNFAVAGHRVGRGAPFEDLDKLRSCDGLVVETDTAWYVYRVLPMLDEVSRWNGRNGDPKCAGVAPLATPYDEAVGRTIVLPGENGVLAPVPDRPKAALAPDKRAALITLTTCEPGWTATHRMIVEGVLTRRYAKDPRWPERTPPELSEPKA